MNLHNKIDLMIFKIMIAREISRTGGINVKDFPSLISKVVRYMNYDRLINPDDLVYLLDILSINGDKITLSNDGIHYLGIIEELINDISKIT